MHDAIRQLDALPYAWTLGKGRVSQGEPLWAIEVFHQSASGIAKIKQRAFATEGNSLSDCVASVVSWADKYGKGSS